MSYAICNELFEDWPLDKTAAFVAELGYQGLELAPFTLCNLVTDLSAADRLRIRRTVEGVGLSVVGLHWLLAQTEGFQLNDSDPGVRARTAQYLLDLIDCCAELGGEVLIFGSPQQRDVPPDRSRAEAWKSTAEIMHACGVRAQQQGVLFCIEPLSRNETNFIVNVDEAAELVRQVDHPGLRMMVDTKAMSHDPRPIPNRFKPSIPSSTMSTSTIPICAAPAWEIWISGPFCRRWTTSTTPAGYRWKYLTSPLELNGPPATASPT